MTAAQIRQSFLDFFREKQHSIVPSASLLPQSPGLLFTNAGMNPFVPYFLGVEKAPYDPPRAADTQKCIRAGGKHNDLEDVGYDTYHHTFFEMLGNWSFGNYFKKEAIQWAWELVVERWGLPAHRLHASVYAPKPGDPGEFDQEAYDIWAELYRSKGCDPAVQIVNGNVKDNFWMMGETGPCGPCSELHVNLTPEGDPKTGRELVNNDSDLCIEIWNLVFIQYNAEADGSFRELPAKHIDTGMGFERACSIIQGTKRFTDFSQKPSNYATDVFQPIFRKLEELSGKTYSNIYPALGADRSAFSEEMKDAIAFRVIADHLRTLSFSIADGIMPGNNGRNYVLRRILRRAVRYGRQLGFSGDKPFFGALVETLVKEMGDVFPELKNRQDTVRATLEQEEASFNQTLDRGLKRFEDAVGEHTRPRVSSVAPSPQTGPKSSQSSEPTYTRRNLPHFERPWGKYMVTFTTLDRDILNEAERTIILDSILNASKLGQIYLYAACVMPDHVHLLIEPQVKTQSPDSDPVFFTLSEILQAIKSVTSHKILKDRRKALQNENIKHLWNQESFDRLIRSESDLIEKYDYILSNPVKAGFASRSDGYAWTWCREFDRASGQAGAEGGSGDTRGRVCSPFSGEIAFELEDTFGFPIDLTELLCAERGLGLDKERYEECKKEQQDRSRAAQKSTVVRALDISTEAVTEFLGFDTDETEATILEVHPQEDALFIITDKTVFYAEMGGQAGDTGTLVVGGVEIPVTGVQQVGKARAHVVDANAKVKAGDAVTLKLDTTRRRPIEAHHSATHLLHWALHEVVSKDAAQQGSSVDENRLRFDFNSAAVTPEQIAAMEEKVNAAIKANDVVSWKEVPHASIKGRPDIMQFFGDKYGDLVRVVQIGGGQGDLTGYSMELCGGTHVRRTGEIGLFKIKSEGAIASGVRRIEAACGEAAWAYLNEAVEKWDAELQAATDKLKAANAKLAALGEAPVTVNEFPHIMGAMLVERADISQLNATFAHGQRTLEETKEAAIEAEKRFKKLQAGAAAKQADAALAELIAAGGPIVATFEADASLLQELLNGFKKQGFGGAGFVIVDDGDKLHLGAYCGDAALAAGHKAGDLLRDLAALAGGKGGGKADQARGAAPERDKLAAIEEAARARLG
ncbi:MAG: alanine--tRNA ligase [Verrucomicrobia bacterium]|nr:MAG: alanine--tRNA ligase [Verrucomicrobiota bacterium]TAE88413.1 MAG: alanine--tRNA ligase [Verrucomicrobiota bacterium]TAF26866.1 MAG: alanine--tRNA ligase [Verrucomicrobiota bacterium]TAF42124.1 MAG: alanine--tRNA ligase [Verrucomicrobiota bacterium]